MEILNEPWQSSCTKLNDFKASVSWYRIEEEATKKKKYEETLKGKENEIIEHTQRYLMEQFSYYTVN